jgi:hypothetical protein
MQTDSLYCDSRESVGEEGMLGGSKIQERKCPRISRQNSVGLVVTSRDNYCVKQGNSAKRYKVCEVQLSYS